MQRIWICSPSFVLAIAAASVSHAQTFNWDGEAGDLQWFSDANWNPDGVPTSTNSVVIDSDVQVEATSLPIDVVSIQATGGGLFINNR